MAYYTYKITNLINHKFYIGKAKDIQKRWSAHKTAAKNKKEGDYSIFHRAITKHGPDNFVVEELTQHEIETNALDQEKTLIKELNAKDRETGYNMTDGGDGASGYRHTEEAKRRMSEYRKGKYVGNSNPFYGQHHTEEMRQQLSAIRKRQNQDHPEKYNQLNIAQCFLNLEECLDIQRAWMQKDVSMEMLSSKYGVVLTTIFHILHGTYIAVRGHSILTEEIFQKIKREKEITQNIHLRKLTSNQEKEIIWKYLNTTVSLKEIANEYLTSPTTIKNTLKRNNVLLRGPKSSKHRL
jgi:group I intron endonuclease